MKQSDQLITVIIPVYNSEKYLHKCIDSVINQSYENLEIILVDDGSTDSSGSICDEYQKNDGRIKVIHKQNGGQASARNAALDIAKGEYISFADSDDWIDSGAYEKLYDSIKLSGAQISVCGRINVYENDMSTVSFVEDEFKVLSPGQTIRKMLIYDNIDASPCDKLFKADLLRNIRFPMGYIAEDIPFVFEAVMKADNVCFVNKALYYYFQRNGSTSKSAFSEKSKGLEMYHRKAAEMCRKSYPEFAMECDYYEYFGLINLAIMMEKTFFDTDKKYYQHIVLKMRKNIFKILRNPYFSSIRKASVVLMCFKLYRPLRCCYHFFRKVIKV